MAGEKGTATFEAVTVVPVPFLSDNYAYLVVENSTNRAVAIDPADPETVTATAARMGVTVAAILTTHYHHDHSGGNHLLHQQMPNVPIYGGQGDGVAAETTPASDGDVIRMGALAFNVLHTPGHTKGHVVYVLRGLVSHPSVLLLRFVLQHRLSPSRWRCAAKGSAYREPRPHTHTPARKTAERCPAHAVFRRLRLHGGMWPAV